MSTLSDLLDFNKFVGRDLFKRIKDDPIRALIGGFTPLDTSVQNALLGREDEPFFTQLGGATPQTFERARESGIDTQAGETAQGIADIIAGIYGARGIGNINGGEASGGKGGFQLPQIPQGSKGGEQQPLPFQSTPVEPFAEAQVSPDKRQQLRSLLARKRVQDRSLLLRALRNG